MRLRFNGKILFACVIFLFIPVSKIFSANEAQAAITAAADQGKDLGSCTDTALTEGIKYAKENGFTDAATRMEGELASREAQRIEAAKIAEMAAAEAVEELMKEQLVLDEAIQELKNLEEQVSECPDCVDLEVLKTAEEKVEEYKKRVEESKQKLAEAADAMKKAYLELGQFYADTQLSGDPVNVGNGKYVAEYIDFEAQDYGKKWKISRNLNYKNYAEGFGLEWSCSLSSRIIRCTAGPMDDSLKEMEKCLDSINKMLQVCEDYQKKFSGYPNEKINKIHDDCSALLDEINTYKKLALDAKEKNQLLDELNRYVRYGRFEDYKKYYYPEDAIIYVDEDGNDCIFKYKASGTWCAVSSITAAHTVIYSLDENLNVSNTNTAEGGFLVEQENGFKRYFNCYGILIKEVDLNGNENNYRNLNGLITEVILKTGETIHINYNNQKQIVSVTGEVSGSACFNYENNFLIKVTGTDNIPVGYSYNAEGDLTVITKADGKEVVITYGKDSSDRKVCISVTDENDSSEFFEYDTRENIVTHTAPAGAIEEYYCNDSGNVIGRQDRHGQSLYFVTNSSGLINEEIRNGERFIYYYNEKNHVTKKINQNGSSKSYIYDDWGNVIKYIDEDGFYSTWDYDEKGNLLFTSFCSNLKTSFTYYPNGLVKELRENDCLYLYEYNQFGSITKKTTVDQKDFNPVVLTEFWKYDKNNRVIEYTDTENRTTKFTYGTNYKCEINSDNLKTEHYYNARQWETKTVQTDLNTGVKYIKEAFYDGRGNVIQILINGNVFADYVYRPDGILTNYTVWNITSPGDFIGKHAVKTSFEFDDFNRVSKISYMLIKADENYIPIVEDKKIISRNNYSNSGIVTEVEHYLNNINPYKYTYNKQGKLIKETSPAGVTKEYKYSQGGRLLTSLNSNGIVEKYSYRTDGRCSVLKQIQNGITSSLEYSDTGVLLYEKDFIGNDTEYFYNGRGFLLQEKSKNLITDYTYSPSGRLLNSKCSQKNGRVVYDYKNTFENKRLVRKNGKYTVAEYEYDAWGRPVVEESASGKRVYEYNCAGQLVGIINGTNEKKLSYNALGQICYEKSSIGDEFIYNVDLCGRSKSNWKNGRCVSSSEYDDYGNTVQLINELGNVQRFTYDSNGFISSVNNYDTGVMTFKKFPEKIEVVDGLGHGKSIVFDKNRHQLIESRGIGKNKVSVYSEFNQLIKRIKYSGKQELYDYDEENNSRKTIFEDGTSRVIQRNFFNTITQMKNSSSMLNYEYDDGLKLVNQKDEISGVNIEYSYDKFGRLSSKKSDYFELFYKYDDSGKITEVSEGKTGTWVKISGSIEEKKSTLKFSDGTICNRFYNQIGQLEGSVYKDRIGQTLSADICIYDENNRISVRCNKNGEFTKYTYDKAGRLIKVLYPYTDEIYDYSLSEFIDCGGTSPNTTVKGSQYSLLQKESSALAEIITKCDRNIYLPANQLCWEVEYGYTDNGSVAYEINPLGKIVYEYDELGRLSNKHTLTTNSFGIRYVWNEDDCLERVESLSYKKEYKYLNENRPVEIHITDYSRNEDYYYSYTYDAIGRRYSEQHNNGDKFVYVYDGLSANVLSKIPVFENGVKDSFSFTKYDDNEYRTTKDFSQENEIRAVNNEKVDVNNQSVSVNTGYYSIINNEQMFLANINIQSENKSIWEINSNISYRDYDASMKCFTTSDPVLDGGNYFAYCATDPVNYADMEGFAKTSLTQEELAVFNAELAEFLKFDQEEFSEGEWNGLLKEFDCADTTAFITLLALKASGTENISADLKKFAEYLEQGDIKKARELINSKSFFEDDNYDSYTQLFRGYDRNYLRNEQFEGCEKYIRELMNQEIALWYLSNPDYIQPGTVLVWKSSDYKTEYDDGNWTGHTLTILARKFDADGNIIGFAYIEGHQNINHLTELGFMDLTGELGKVFSLDAWRGDFLGAYEMEGADEHWEGMIKQCSK